MALTTNLISYWKLDEASGDAADSVGGNTLTNNNTVPFAAAKINNGAGFNIDSDSDMGFSIADAAQTGLDISGSFSISCWLNIGTVPTNNGDPYTIVEKWGSAGGNKGYILIYKQETGLGLQLQIFDANANQTATFHTGIDLGTATWHHIVAVFNTTGPTITFYIDGTEHTTTLSSSLATSIGDNASDFYVGSGFNTTQTDWSSRMYMDELGIWSRVLTSTEVTSLYNSGAGLQYPFAAGPIGPFPTHLNP